MSKNTAKNSGIGGTVLAVVVTLAVAGTGGYMFGARAAQPEAQVVARVNDKVITKNDLYERMVKQNGASLVEQMIEEEIVNQASAAANVKVTDAEVEAEIKKIKDQMGGDAAFEQALAQYGITLDQLKQDQTFRLKVSRILAKDIPTDDASLQKYFDENKASFDTREVHSRHILVATEDEAKAVKAELDKGADFATLAKAKSTDPTAKDNGGDLGFNKQGNMVEAFDKVVFNMQKGQISAPFQTEFGWHVAQVVDMKGAVPTFASVKEKVKEAYVASQVGEKIRPWLDEQKAKAKITNTLANK